MNLQEHTTERFLNQHKTIKSYIDDLPPEAIYSRLIPDKFSIHETIAYLTRYHHVFMYRLKSIIKDVNPFFEIYKPEFDPEFGFSCAKSTGSLLHEMYRLREEICTLLENAGDECSSRVGTHAALGRMTISQWTEFFLLHESAQLFKIFKLAGTFWSMETEQHTNVIHLPRLTNYLDELAV